MIEPTSIPRSLLSAALVLALTQGATTAHPAFAASLPVSNCADDGSPGTLRSVVMTAADGDVVDLSGLSCDHITLTQGPIDISVHGPHRVDDLTFTGPGMQRLIIDGASASRILVHGTDDVGIGLLSIQDLTLAHALSLQEVAACVTSNGNVVLDHVALDDCHTGKLADTVFGGAIAVFGNLTMVSSRITGSSSSNSYGAAAGGGAYVGHDATIVASTISGNTASGAGMYSRVTGGGGIYVVGDLSISESTISGNTVTSTAPPFGGGVFGRRNITIVRSVLNDNHSDLSGGAIVKSGNVYDPGAQSRALLIMDSTISGNTAQVGGGIVSAYPTSILNSTVAFNHAGAIAGGVYFSVATTYSALTMQSSIIANNVAGDTTHAADLATYSSQPVPITGANDLVMSADANFQLPADTLSVDPLLAPLADNGGPTMTHALLAGSPALDAGDNFFGFPTDQRGYARVSGPAADIGAFEQVQDLIFEDGFD